MSPPTTATVDVTISTCAVGFCVFALFALVAISPLAAVVGCSCSGHGKLLQLGSLHAAYGSCFRLYRIPTYLTPYSVQFRMYVCIHVFAGKRCLFGAGLRSLFHVDVVLSSWLIFSGFPRIFYLVTGES